MDQTNWDLQNALSPQNEMNWLCWTVKQSLTAGVNGSEMPK